jgi:hypothetical protein
VADRMWRRVHPPAFPPRLMTDGHGNWWERCNRDDCDLHITRPGEADCHHDDCPEKEARRG